MRYHYLDNIRWVTVLLVMFFHVFYYFNAYCMGSGIGGFNDYQPQDAVLYLLYPWLMPLLFVVAGMSWHSGCSVSCLICRVIFGSQIILIIQPL